MMSFLQVLSFGLMMTFHPYNMFDLSHLHVNHINNFAYTQKPFEVRENQMYTLAFDDAVIGQYFDYMDQEVLVVDGAVDDDYAFIYNEEYQLFYVTFETNEPLLHIEYLPWNHYGDIQIVMYEGDFQSFKGFTVYQVPMYAEYVDVRVPELRERLDAPWILFDEDNDKKIYQYEGRERYLYVYTYDVKDPLFIEGPHEIFVYSDQSPLTSDDILSYFTSNGTLSIEQDNYQMTQEGGSYDIVIHTLDIYGDVMRHYLTISVIDVYEPQIVIDDFLIEKSVFDVMNDEDIIHYIQTYIHTLNIDGDVYIKQNDYEMSLFNETYDVSYEVLAEDNRYEGVMRIHSKSLIYKHQLDLYVYIIASVLGIGSVILWISIRKKRQ